MEHEVVDVAADDAGPELRRRHDQRARAYERVDRNGSGINSCLKNPIDSFFQPFCASKAMCAWNLNLVNKLCESEC